MKSTALPIHANEIIILCSRHLQLSLPLMYFYSPRYSFVLGLIALLMTLTPVVAQHVHPETGEALPAPASTEDSFIPDQSHNTTFTNNGGETLTLIKHLADGEGEGVSISGDTLYRSNGGYFEVLDVSDINSPEVLDQLLVESSLAETAWIEGEIAYVTSSRTAFPQGAGLRIVDISDPTNLTVVGQALGQSAYGVTVDGDYAYVGTGLSGLSIYDITDPSEPTLVGTLPPPEGGSVLHAALNGTTAYMSAGLAGFATADLSDPSNPTLLDDISFGGFASNVAFANDVAFVPVNGLGLVSVDVSDPSDITQLDIFNIESSQVRDVALDGDTAYVVGDHGLLILDVSDPTDMAEIGSLAIPGSGSGQSVVLEGDQAFVASRYHGVRSIDVSDPSAPAEVTRIPNGGFSFRVYIEGDYAYISDIQGELRILDISNPEAAEIVGRVETIPNMQNSIVRDGIAYITDAGGESTGLSRYDVSDPTNPQPIDVFATGNQAFGIDLDGDEAYIANGFNQFISVDISEPGNFSILDVLNPNNTANDVRTQDEVAYVAASFEGLVTVDVSDPSAMAQLNTSSAGSFTLSLTLKDTLAYLADGTEGFAIVDITDPVEPQVIGTAPVGNIARGVAASQDFAYIADEFIGLKQYDVTDPENPIETAATLSNNRLIDVAVKDSLVVAVDAGGGVYLYEHPQPVANESNPGTGALELADAQPNPFRSQTTIGYYLPQSESVTLEVYDMLGRRVETLVNTDLSGGWHEARLDVEGLSGGLYVIRLKAGAETLSRKVTVMR